jgi:hypothetical protein
VSWQQSRRTRNPRSDVAGGSAYVGAERHPERGACSTRARQATGGTRPPERKPQSGAERHPERGRNAAGHGLFSGRPFRTLVPVRRSATFRPSISVSALVPAVRSAPDERPLVPIACRPAFRGLVPPRSGSSFRSPRAFRPVPRARSGRSPRAHGQTTTNSSLIMPTVPNDFLSKRIETI